MEDHLPPDAPKNFHNGHSPKTVQDELGEVRIDIPRDRNGTEEAAPGIEEQLHAAVEAKNQDPARELSAKRANEGRS